MNKVKSKPKESFGKILQMYRIRHNISQSDFAKQLGTTQQVLSYYENELRVPKISFAKKFKDVTGIDLMEGIEQVFFTNMTGQDKMKSTISAMAVENNGLKKENAELKLRIKQLEDELRVFSKWADSIKKGPII